MKLNFSTEELEELPQELKVTVEKTTEGDVDIRINGRNIAYLSSTTGIITKLWIEPSHQDRFPGIKFDNSNYIVTEEH